MKKITCLLFAMLCAATVSANDAIVIQSASVDWEAATGAKLREYKINFANTKGAGTGWEMYYLDAFPCYGVGQYVRAWVSAKENDAFVRLLCVFQPKEIKFAYRPAKRDDRQSRATGILQCKVEKNLSVKLDSCAATSWAEYNN